MMNVKVKFHDTFIMYNFVFIVINSLYSKTKAFQKHEYSCHNFLSPGKENVSERERERRGRWGQNNTVIHNVTCLHPVFGPPFTPCLLFQWYPQSKDILLNLSMKCSNSV